MRRARWFAAMLLAAPLVAAAETAYVSDRVTIPLRAAATADAAVIANLSVGASVEVLEHADAYARVRDADGIEGWVDAALLSTQAPAAQQVKALRAELDRTRNQLVAAQTQLDKSRTAPAPDGEKTQAELAAAREQLEQAQAEIKKQEQELAAANRRVAEASAPAAAAEGKSGFSFVWLAVAFAMLVLGFIGGIVWVRESIRRRMGGLYLRI
jgi:SH3 domain protein